MASASHRCRQTDHRGFIGPGRARPEGRCCRSPTIGCCPALAPLLLPWLAMLGLLALKPNRCAAAWWIWLPLGCVIAFTLALLPVLPSGANFFLDVIAALAVGLAARLAPVRLSPAATSVRDFSVRPARLGGFQRAGLCRRGKTGVSRRKRFVSVVLLAVGVWSARRR